MMIVHRKYFFLFTLQIFFIHFYSHSIITPYSNPIEICDLIFSHLNEFNYPCIAHDSQIPFIDNETQRNVFLKNAFLSEIPYYGEQLISPECFNTLINLTLKAYDYELNSPETHWSNDHSLQLNYIHTNCVNVYGGARIVPEDMKIIAMGDYHGNVHSLARNIKRLEKLNFISAHGILNHDVMLILLGDLGDRGHYSIETWALAMSLKINNPNNVIILQGNHETPDLFNSYGFKGELLAKFGEQETRISEAQIFNLFKLLPQVYFIGTEDSPQHISFIQFNHGGIGAYGNKNVGYKHMAVKSLLSECTAHQEYTRCCHVYENRIEDNGFIWNDFSANPLDKRPSAQGQRSDLHLVFHGNAVMEYVRKTNTQNFSLCGFIRGHAHLPGGINQLRYYNDRKLDNEYNIWMKDWTPLHKHAIAPINFINEEQGFPIFTITSICDFFHDEAFAILFFDETTKYWSLENLRFKGPQAGLKKQKCYWKSGIDELMRGSSFESFSITDVTLAERYSTSYEDLTTYHR